MNKRGLIGTIIILGVLAVAGFFWFVGMVGDEGNFLENNTGLANPASVYCVQQGYELEIWSGEDGEYGVCIGDDGVECEEWAFFRGECALREGLGIRDSELGGLEQRCVPSSCCHAEACVWESEAPECGVTFCTMECVEGTMDCGAGHCEVVDGECGVAWDE